MKIYKKETTMLIALGLGLLYLRSNNHDVNKSGTADEDDKGLIILAGAIALMLFM
jgi:hypothetical protein